MRSTLCVLSVYSLCIYCTPEDSTRCTLSVQFVHSLCSLLSVYYCTQEDRTLFILSVQFMYSLCTIYTGGQHAVYGAVVVQLVPADSRGKAEGLVLSLTGLLSLGLLPLLGL